MTIALYTMLAFIALVGVFAVYIRIALWLNGLAVDEDGKREYPWRKD
jgi:hypothetical protein